MQSISFRIEGTTPLMVNNPRTVNPFDEYSKLLKPLTSKRSKTDEDMLEISRIKFLASLYRDIRDEQYILPAQNLEQAVVEAARERKRGKNFERSFRIYDDATLVFPDMDKTPQQLYEMGIYVDVRAVGIKDVKIPTTRAIFPEWSAAFTAYYDDNQLNEDEVREFLEIAGLRYHVGTYRRKYGAFKVIFD